MRLGLLFIYLFILYLKGMSAPIYLEKQYASDDKRRIICKSKF
jgi:hypothetical protein